MAFIVCVVKYQKSGKTVKSYKTGAIVTGIMSGICILADIGLAIMMHFAIMYM